MKMLKMSSPESLLVYLALSLRTEEDRLKMARCFSRRTDPEQRSPQASVWSRRRVQNYFVVGELDEAIGDVLSDWFPPVTFNGNIYHTTIAPERKLTPGDRTRLAKWIQSVTGRFTFHYSHNEVPVKVRLSSRGARPLIILDSFIGGAAWAHPTQDWSRSFLRAAVATRADLLQHLARCTAPRLEHSKK